LIAQEIESWIIKAMRFEGYDLFTRMLDPKKSGKPLPYRGRILNWGAYGSYSNFKTAIEEEQEAFYKDLIKLNIYNMLGFKIDFEKNYESFGPSEVSQGSNPEKIAVLSGSSNQKNTDNSMNIGKRNKIRILSRDSAIEVN
jgi:hypothetical protein